MILLFLERSLELVTIVSGLSSHLADYGRVLCCEITGFVTWKIAAQEDI